MVTRFEILVSINLVKQKLFLISSSRMANRREEKKVNFFPGIDSLLIVTKRLGIELSSQVLKIVRCPPYQGGIKGGSVPRGGSNSKSIFSPLDGSSYRKQKPNERRLCPINWIFPVFINDNLLEYSLT